MKKIFPVLLFAALSFVFAPVANAADSSSCVAPAVIGGVNYCPAGQDYWSSTCNNRITCTANYTFSCGAGKCCYNLDDGTHDNYNDGQSCSAINRGYDGCSGGTPAAAAGACIGCANGFTLIGGQCVASCNPATELRLANGSCLSMQYVKTTLDFILSTLSGLTGIPFCTDQAMCGVGQTCNNYLCSGSGTVGSACTENIQCGPGLLCSATTNTCADPYPANQSCTTTAQCPANNVCLLNNCFPTNAPAGTACTTAAQCNYGLVCNNPGGGNLAGICEASGIASATRFAFLSSTGYASSITGYAGATGLNSICTTTDANSHVCSADEIIASYDAADPVVLAQTTGIGIINNGPPGYTVFANDCNGWTARGQRYLGTEAFGAAWYFADKNSSLVRCDWLADTVNKPAYKVACCK